MAEADEILYSWGPGQSQLALLCEGQLVELRLARADLVAGAVFLGRVIEVSARLDSAFIDIGLARPGLLSGAEGLSQGQSLLVQVRADAREGKGAVLTADIALAGRWLAYTPFRPGVAASRQLAPEYRDRLLRQVEDLAAPEEGVVLRSAAAGRSDAELRSELDALRGAWEDAEARRVTAKAPALLWRPDPLARALADNPLVTRVRVDDSGLYAAARRQFGSLVELHRDGPLFAAAGIEDDVANALAPVVPLQSGGRISIEPTPALTAIDVDSGSGSPADANREAVDEIARQLRLRNIGGQIVIDFVSAGGKGPMFKLAGNLKRAVMADPTPTHVFGITPLGLVELTRERFGPSLSELLTERETRPLPSAAAYAALRLAVSEAMHRPGKALSLVVAPAVAMALAGLGEAKAEAEARIGTALTIITDGGRGVEEMQVEERG